MTNMFGKISLNLNFHFFLKLRITKKVPLLMSVTVGPKAKCLHHYIPLVCLPGYEIVKNEHQTHQVNSTFRARTV